MVAAWWTLTDEQRTGGGGAFEISDLQQPQQMLITAFRHASDPHSCEIKKQ